MLKLFVPSSGPCGVNVTENHFSWSDGNACYYDVYSGTYHYVIAKKLCADLGMRLASIETTEELEVIKGHLKGLNTYGRSEALHMPQ